MVLDPFQPIDLKLALNFNTQIHLEVCVSSVEILRKMALAITDYSLDTLIDNLILSASSIIL